MDLPQPPADIDLKNIIDKLAQFVARNGPEFEQMTKNKQKDNPKFSFLFGGELFNYYQYKVTTEQAILKLKSVAAMAQTNTAIQQSHLQAQGLMNQTNNSSMTMMSNQPSAPHWTPAQPPPTPIMNTSITLTSIMEQQNVLQQQITQSEQNLAAQHASLMLSQDTVIDETIRKFQLEKLTQRSIENGINLSELDTVLQPIIDSCTKDSISAGKAWILAHNARDTHDVVAEYLMMKVIANGVPFTQKLHIIYLVNDVMHHCVRKNAEGLKKSLENVVVPMFCNSWVCGTQEQQEKLRKLLNLWEAKNNYFSRDVIQKMMTPDVSWKAYQEEKLRKHEDVSAPVKINTAAQYEGYRSQHDLFVNHAISQIQTLEKEKMEIERQQKQEVQMKLQMQNIQPPGMMSDDMRPLSYATPPPNVLPPGAPFIPPPPDFSHLPPELLPDFSRPPPGFEPEPILEDVIPTVPYFDLPAGLMVTIVSIDDFNYKPIDPSKLRLPPAVPPSERLVQAVEAFYQKTYTGNTRERLILDADGWEKLGLYEYYKAKNAARKKKEAEIEAGTRERSRSPSPIRREKSRSRSPKKKRCYRSKSPSPEKMERTRSRSRSRTPPSRRSNGRRSPRKSKRRSRSRSKSVSPPSRARSTTPPSFGNFGPSFGEKLDESNKGHEMLKKMGWGGAGLGSKEQGIADPISGGDVRDRVDQYKGVGVNLHDPYESFRKNRGKAYIVRMKERAEERSVPLK